MQVIDWGTAPQSLRGTIRFAVFESACIHFHRLSGRICTKDKNIFSVSLFFFSPSASFPACACVCACRWKPACLDTAVATPLEQGQNDYILHTTPCWKDPSINSQSYGVHTIEKSKLLITINSAVLYVSLCLYKRWVFFYLVKYLFEALWNEQPKLKVMGKYILEKLKRKEKDCLSRILLLWNEKLYIERGCSVSIKQFNFFENVFLLFVCFIETSRLSLMCSEYIKDLYKGLSNLSVSVRKKNTSHAKAEKC